MSTRSSIGVVRDGERTGKFVYCHFDGYPEWNGFMLQTHYNSVDKAERLIAQGNISSLRETHAKTRFDYAHSVKQKAELIEAGKQLNQDWTPNFANSMPRTFKWHDAPSLHWEKKEDYEYSLSSLLHWHDHCGAEYAYIFCKTHWITSPLTLPLQKHYRDVKWQPLTEVLKGRQFNFGEPLTDEDC